MKKTNLPRLIGVIHLPALPGAAKNASSMSEIVTRSVAEAKLLAHHGFEGIIIENFGDVPFAKTSVPAITIACVALVAHEIRKTVKCSLGINVLRNDAIAALSIAAATRCNFIRVNVLSGVYATDQGLIEGSAHDLLRIRQQLDPQISILADVHVKHAKCLSSDDLDLCIEETFERAGADGIIITGKTTGRSVGPATLNTAALFKNRVPIFIGSGATSKNLSELLPNAYGVIVGSAMRKNSRAGAPLDPKAIKKFIQEWVKLS